MPLPAGLSQFVLDLKAYDQKPLAQPVDAATAFTDIFATFFGYASLNGTPITMGTNLSPAAKQAMVGPLTQAFTAPLDPASSGALMEAAFLAYLNSGISSMWPIANSVAGKPAPLNLMSNLGSIASPGAATPKSDLANGIMAWLQGGAQATLSISPWTAFFQ